MIRPLMFLVWLVLRAYAAFRPCKRIELGGDVYMRRWFLTSRPSKPDETGPPGYCLQCIYRADADRRMHNHPWDFARSIILRGWYCERSRYLDSPVTWTKYYPGDVNTLTEPVFHRITAVSPGGVWTFFYAGPKHGRGWGFQ